MNGERQNDRNRQAQNKLCRAKDHGVDNEFIEIKRFEECLEMLEANPGTAFDALKGEEIFKGDLRIVDWDVAKNQIVS